MCRKSNWGTAQFSVWQEDTKFPLVQILRSVRGHKSHGCSVNERESIQRFVKIHWNAQSRSTWEQGSQSHPLSSEHTMIFNEHLHGDWLCLCFWWSHRKPTHFEMWWLCLHFGYMGADSCPVNIRSWNTMCVLGWVELVAACYTVPLLHAFQCPFTTLEQSYVTPKLE